jgi:predicted RNase H-like HicB family nuclease
LSKVTKVLDRVIRGTSDANIRFDDLRALLRHLVQLWKEKRMANKIQYEIILYWSKEDEAFIAEVPELPGCVADGATYQEALVNAERVIREWIETAQELGRQVPEPRGRLIYA